MACFAAVYFCLFFLWGHWLWRSALVVFGLTFAYVYLTNIRFVLIRTGLLCITAALANSGVNLAVRVAQEGRPWLDANIVAEVVSAPSWLALIVGSCLLIFDRIKPYIGEPSAATAWRHRMAIVPDLSKRNHFTIKGIVGLTPPDDKPFTITGAQATTPWLLRLLEKSRIRAGAGFLITDPMMPENKRDPSPTVPARYDHPTPIDASFRIDLWSPLLAWGFATHSGSMKNPLRWLVRQVRGGEVFVDIRIDCVAPIPSIRAFADLAHS